MIETNIFKLEIRRNLKANLIWSISIGLSMILVVVLYPLVKDMYQMLPAELEPFLESFGGLPDNVTEYFATEGAMMYQIFGAIFAGLLGFNAIARDEKEKTVEGVYTLPISRTKFFVSKVLAITLNITIFSVLVTILTLVGFIFVNDGFMFLEFMIFTFFNTLMLIFIGYLGLILASLTKVNTSQLIAIIIPIPLYIIFMISTLTDSEILKALKHITPFTFCNPAEIIKADMNIEYISLLIYLFIVVVGLLIANIRFKKREFIV
ncbi:MAG: ABC transporter permease subunit [Bacilli bacterium]|nr:ABC transporter permease subunit [Bacilli bacterium]